MADHRQTLLTILAEAQAHLVEAIDAAGRLDPAQACAVLAEAEDAGWSLTRLCDKITTLETPPCAASTADDSDSPAPSARCSTAPP